MCLSVFWFMFSWRQSLISKGLQFAWFRSFSITPKVIFLLLEIGLLILLSKLMKLRLWELGNQEIKPSSALLKNSNTPFWKTQKIEWEINSKQTMKQKQKFSSTIPNIMTVMCGNWMLTLHTDRPVVMRQDHVAPRSALMKVIYGWDMLYEMWNCKPSPACQNGLHAILEGA